jgi:DNA-directed RNA polymerase subunit RPC12/RpoP
MTEADLFARALPIENHTAPTDPVSVTLRCPNCRRAIAADETVYRLVVGDYWRDRWRCGYGAVSICADCSKGVPRQVVIAGRTYDHVDYPGGSDQQWRTPMACRSCGRLVVYTGRRRLPRSYAITCSKTCQQRAYVSRVWRAERSAIR